MLLCSVFSSVWIVFIHSDLLIYFSKDDGGSSLWEVYMSKQMNNKCLILMSCCVLLTSMFYLREKNTLITWGSIRLFLFQSKIKCQIRVTISHIILKSVTNNDYLKSSLFQILFSAHFLWMKSRGIEWRIFLKQEWHGRSCLITSGHAQ